MVERAGRVEGKVAIVTGAGSTPGPGIGTGKATAVVLAREGARVLLVDLHPERADETRADDRGRGRHAPQVFAADVTERGRLRGDGARRRRRVRDGRHPRQQHRSGRRWAPSSTLSEEQWDRALDINLRTAFLASKYAVPVMAAQGARLDRQRVVDLRAAR